MHERHLAHSRAPINRICRHHDYAFSVFKSKFNHQPSSKGYPLSLSSKILLHLYHLSSILTVLVLSWVQISYLAKYTESSFRARIVSSLLSVLPDNLLYRGKVPPKTDFPVAYMVKNLPAI